jgi:4-hydroxybenzoate polyprenyltransferase
MRTANGLLKLTRFPLVFTAIADSAVGAALVGVNLLTCVRVLPAVGASALLYAAGMAMNDLCDVDRDRTLHPERPIPSGKVSRNQASVFVGVLVGLAGIVGGLASLEVLAAVVVVAGLILLYNRFLKRHAIAGSIGMGAVRASNMALGAVAVGSLPGSPEFPWISTGVLAAYVFVLTLWSTREDRPGTSRIFPAIVGTALIWTPLAGALRPVPRPWAALLASAWIAPWVFRAVRKPDPGRMMQVVRWGVLGIIVLDASFLGALGRWSEAGVVFSLLIPALMLLPLFKKL